MNAREVQIVGKYTSRRELLGARDNNAVVALLDDAGVESWIALLMRRPAPVDLGRNDRVAGIEVIVAEVLVESDHIVSEVLATGGKHTRGCRKSGKEPSDMVWSPAHQTKGRFSPGFRAQPLGAEI